MIQFKGDPPNAPLTNPALVARQPICDTSQRTIGYELLYRHSRENFATIRNPDQATAHVVVNSFLEIGLDRMVGSSLAFINVTRDFILSDFCRSLPKDRVVFEILEGTVADRPLIEAVQRLSEDQYRFALDDFAFEPSRLPLLPFCSYVKVDLRLVDRSTIWKELGPLKGGRAKLVAEKVESFEEFDFCKAAGFQYFQGYFFCRPRILSSSRMPPTRVALCRLLSKLQQHDISVREVEEVVEEDISLSYRLLRYINSACVALPKKIDSISHAVRLVGLDSIKLLASLIMLTSLDDKPRELLITSLVRARMCALLAAHLKNPNPEGAFTVGLFSALDAFLDCSMQEALSLLPLSDDIRQALLTHTGALGQILQCTLACEQEEWEAPELRRLESGIVGQSYVTALEWAQNLSQLFSADSA
jgi:EAL and modified HD-GYP domain-containing signal transduction protein